MTINPKLLEAYRLHIDEDYSMAGACQKTGVALEDFMNQENYDEYGVICYYHEGLNYEWKDKK